MSIYSSFDKLRMNGKMSIYSSFDKLRMNGKNMTQMQYARDGIITDQMHVVAKDEHLDPEFVRKEVVQGKLIIPANINHKNLKPIGIGISVRCKINANIGNSSESSDIEQELKKMRVALHYGSDAVMDL